MKKCSIINQIRPFASDRKPRFCWKPGETFKFESLWSLLNKFCLWNAISLTNLVSLLNRFNQLQNNWSVYRTTSPNEGDLKTIAYLLGINVECVNESIASTYLRGQGGSMFVASYLRFCPECIRSGYHSSIFQLQFVSRCPCHHETLMEKCPFCKKIIPYNISRYDRRAPYSCQCGNRLWLTEFLKRRGFRPNDIRMDGFAEIACWLKNRHEPCNPPNFVLASMEQCRSRLSIEHIKNYAAYCGNVEGESVIPSSFMVAAQLLYKKHNIIEPCKTVSAEMFDKERVARTLDLGNIYIRTARHILTEILHDHNDCIELAMINLPWDVMANFTCNLKCIYSQAYLLWRMHWEGKCIPMNLKYHTAHYKLSQKVVSLYDERYRIDSNNSLDGTNVESLCDKYIFEQFMHVSFWMCLSEVRRRIVEADYGWDYHNLLNKDHPFVIIIPGHANDMTEVHSWLPKIIIKHKISRSDQNHKNQLRKQLIKMNSEGKVNGWKVISNPSVYRVFRIRNNT